MTKTIRREILIPQPREQVWRALTDSTALAEWMFPNDLVHSGVPSSAGRRCLSSFPQ